MVPPIQPSVVIALSEVEFDLFFPGLLLTRLKQLVPQAQYFEPDGSCENWESFLATRKPEILVTGWKTARIPVSLSNLRYLCHVGGSIRRHVPRTLLENGILVSNWGGIVAEVVAEGALSLVLSALRRIQFFGDQMHHQKGWSWAPAGTLSLFERRVGIHGFGAIARSLLPMLRLFRCPLRVYSTGVPDVMYEEYGVTRAGSLEELFEWADVLVEAEALTPDNEGCVDEGLLRRLRPDSVFVNIARGALVDEGALVRAVKECGLRVALDTYREEPLPVDSPLRGLQGVVLTPHIGGPTIDRSYLCGELALNNITSFLCGRPISSAVTLEIYDRST